MSTMRDDIERWLTNAGPRDRWMVVMCDTFDWSDYPVYCETPEKVWQTIDGNGKNMAKYMECYDLALPLEPQLSAIRSHNRPPRPPAATTDAKGR